MISKRLLLTLLISALFAGAASIAAADVVIPTNLPGGADAELREEITEFDPNGRLNVAGRRGAQTELASRIQNNVLPANETGPPFTRTDRSSNMLIRFNIRGLTIPQVTASTGVDLRTTWHSGNLPQSQETATNNSQGRLKYTYDPNEPDDGNPNTPFVGSDTLKADDNGNEETRFIGFNYWALNAGHPANSVAGKFIENGPATNPAVVTYYNAPGILPDGNIGTIDIDPGQTVFLGNKKLPAIGVQNHLPVGGEFLFDLPSLKAHLIAAITAGDEFLNVLVAIDHDGNANFTQFTNHNYIVNPKEKLTLNGDTNYDSDVTNPNNPLSQPNSGAANTGQFSPQLILRGVVPEPSSLALLGLGSLATMSILRRRRT